MSLFENMSEAIDYIVAYESGSVSLDEISAQFDMSPTVFQKQFQSYTGVTPNQMQRFLKLSRARDLLLEGHSTLDAAYDAGLSGNARLHDNCVLIEAATPGELKSKGKGVDIYYGWHKTPFGTALIGETNKGICWLSFELEGDRDISFRTMKRRFENANIQEDIKKTKGNADRIISLWSGDNSKKIRLNLYGTNFQLQVWQALLKIPRGSCVSYSAIAEEICSKKASRAVGTAVGRNPISYLIPCHRVIQQSGIVENYAWGSARKKVLLGLEGLS